MPFYAVARGHTVGIYENWAECEKMVKGFKGARYKKFNSKDEAKEFVDEHKTISLTSVTAQLMSTSNDIASSSSSGVLTKFKVSIKETDGIHVKKRRHYSIAHEKSVVKNAQAAVPPKKIKPLLVSDVNSANIPVVYTDGACSNNGKRRVANAAKAGYGVFWGDGHPDNTSAPVEGAATNNRAEYTAVIVALQQAIRNSFSHIIVRTDSMLLINSLTIWRKAWKRNNWRKKDGTVVLNVDLLKQLDSLLENIYVTFEHVKAHIGIHGNEMADELARQGAMLYQGNC